jgi:hypothetical protein
MFVSDGCRASQSFFKTYLKKSTRLTSLNQPIHSPSVAEKKSRQSKRSSSPSPSRSSGSKKPVGPSPPPLEVVPVTPEGKKKSSSLPPTPVSKSGSGLRDRLVFGSLLVVIILCIVYLGHSAVALTLFVLQVGVFRELMNVRYKEGKSPRCELSTYIHACIHTPPPSTQLLL